MTTPAIEVVGATVTFGGSKRGDRCTPALTDIDLTVEPGEILVVVGPSGSGKTTLLRAIAGLETLDLGRINVAGNDVTEWPPGRRDLSFVFQDLALLPHLDVAANIGFGELARGTKRSEVKAKVEAAATSFGLTPLLRRKPHALSGGERQKVALARAVVRQPQAFLMDEPLSHLDPLVRVGARTDLLHLRDRLGVPIVYVTHDPHEALGFGDRVAILHAGRLVQVGTPDEVYSRPRDTFVATFIGPLPMNLIPGEGVVLGVRPEHIGFAPSPEGAISGTVTRILHAGADAITHVTCEHDVPVVVRTAWESRPSHGARVGLSWSQEDEHRFDPESGLRR